MMWPRQFLLDPPDEPLVIDTFDATLCLDDCLALFHLLSTAFDGVDFGLV